MQSRQERRRLPATVSQPDDSRFRRLVESLPDCALILLDPEGRILSWNAGAERIKGFRADEIIGEHISRFYSPQANAVGHPDSELEIARATGRYEEEGWRLRRDGSFFWAHVVLTALRDEEGNLEGFGKFTRDLTDKLQTEQQAANTLGLLRTTVRTDDLTGLLNRRGLDEALAGAMATDQPFSVAMLDLDKFKEVNDRHGHSAGDRLLIRASNAWRAALRADDVLARYGGDEFALIMPGCTLAEGIAVADRLRMQTPAECSCSAGVAAWSPGVSIDELLGAADRCLYESKSGGGDTISPSGATVVTIARQS